MKREHTCLVAAPGERLCEQRCRRKEATHLSCNSLVSSFSGIFLSIHFPPAPGKDPESDGCAATHPFSKDGLAEDGGARAPTGKSRETRPHITPSTTWLGRVLQISWTWTTLWWALALKFIIMMHNLTSTGILTHQRNYVEKSLNGQRRMDGALLFLP